MFGGLNLKSLSDKLNESLHDLENTLAQGLPSTSTAANTTSPPRQQPARTASSPAASPSSARTRPSLDSVATRAQSVAGGLGNLSSPLSPTAIANAQQSASQLAEGALSSLRASLRKGRQSLDTVTRASLDGGRSSSDGGRPAAALTSPSKREGSIKEEELTSIKKDGAAPEEKEPEAEEKLVDIGVAGPAEPHSSASDAPLVDLYEPPARSDSPAPFDASASLAPPDRPAPFERKPSSLLDPPTPEEGEDDDAWGVGSVGIQTPAILQGETPVEEEDVKGDEGEGKDVDAEKKTSIEKATEPSPSTEERDPAPPTASARVSEPEIIPLQDSTSALQSTEAAPAGSPPAAVCDTAQESDGPAGDTAAEEDGEEQSTPIVELAPAEKPANTAAVDDEASAPSTAKQQDAPAPFGVNPEPAASSSPGVLDRPASVERPASITAAPEIQAGESLVLNEPVAASPTEAEPAVAASLQEPAPSVIMAKPETSAVHPTHDDAVAHGEKSAISPAEADVEEQSWDTPEEVETAKEAEESATKEAEDITSPSAGPEEPEKPVEVGESDRPVETPVEVPREAASERPVAPKEMATEPGTPFSPIDLRPQLMPHRAAPRPAAPADEPSTAAVPSDDRLAGLKASLDKVVAALTPLGSVDDVQAFEDELRNMKSKAEMAVKEVARLTGQLDRESLLSSPSRKSMY